MKKYTYVFFSMLLCNIMLFENILSLEIDTRKMFSINTHTPDWKDNLRGAKKAFAITILLSRNKDLDDVLNKFNNQNYGGNTKELTIIFSSKDRVFDTSFYEKKGFAYVFNKVFPNLKQLRIFNANDINMDIFFTKLNKPKNLEVLEIIDSDKNDVEFVRFIPNLKKLKLKNWKKLLEFGLYTSNYLSDNKVKLNLENIEGYENAIDKSVIKLEKKSIDPRFLYDKVVDLTTETVLLKRRIRVIEDNLYKLNARLYEKD